MRESPAPVNGQSVRSEIFHIVVGHYSGCGWAPEQICAHLEQFPDGVGGRYLRENRLGTEIERSLEHLRTYSQRPQFGSSSRWTSEWTEQPAELESEKSQEPEPKLDQPEEEPELNQPQDPDLEEDLEEEKPPDLPQMFCHGDPDTRPLKSWAIKGLIPAVGHGLMSGQWGVGKTFVALELSGSMMTGQPFLDRLVKRQCGVLLLAAEGVDEVRRRLEVLVQHKCGKMPRAPFRWYETVPLLLQPNAAEKLIAMARQADASLQAEFGLPLGLIIIDTVVASAGYNIPGAENDSAINQAIMNLLRTLAQAVNCFVLGVDHFGKNVETGTRGSSSKEASADLVLACLGDRELSGRVLNTRLAIRKCRGGAQGAEFPFVLREVKSSEQDDDGDPLTSMVVEWQTGPGQAAAAASPARDPWRQSRQHSQRTLALRLKRVLMAVFASRGVDRSVGPAGPTLRMVDQEIVRAEFNARTAADGTAQQKAWHLRQQFSRTVDWAEEHELIDRREIDGIAYLWLTRPEPSREDD